MNLLQRLLLKLHKPPVPPHLTVTQDSVSTPLGLKTYREVNTQAKLDEGVARARKRSYVRGRGDEC